jgi:D-beta-D-heptose 7-phosphate kinase/D-beta-D-heptose 1-phosphate adenosyltransferase
MDIDMSKKYFNKKAKKIVMVSGGFDPVHIGHVRLFNDAKKLGNELVVVINNDHWLRSKKGYAFMPDFDRKEIIEAIKSVDRVFLSSHKKNTKDFSISKDIAFLRPHIFANGGDRDEKNASNPESSLYKDIEMCKKLGIEMVFNVGHGGKVRSSSDLVKQAQKLKIAKKKKM